MIIRPIQGKCVHCFLQVDISETFNSCMKVQEKLENCGNRRSNS